MQVSKIDNGKTHVSDQDIENIKYCVVCQKLNALQRLPSRENGTKKKIRSTLCLEGKFLQISEIFFLERFRTFQKTFCIYKESNCVCTYCMYSELFYFFVIIVLFTIMDISKSHVRDLLLYDFKSGLTGAGSSRCIKAGFRYARVSEHTTQDWNTRFLAEKYILKDATQSGRHSEVAWASWWRLIPSNMTWTRRYPWCTPYKHWWSPPPNGWAVKDGQMGVPQNEQS